ncbi:DOT1 [Candida pseudojiufengensis]|uniref:DOT1 n=1 Tax=Candida pseudojiufengensis TaxID=497109 RepID=UPI0022246DE7|nr:DOT1 [Candida pseudojiufengensis]KAI5959177.1 DOT1 [Candida pseudojiufengensis]
MPLKPNSKGSQKSRTTSKESSPISTEQTTFSTDLQHCLLQSYTFSEVMKEFSNHPWPQLSKECFKIILEMEDENLKILNICKLLIHGILHKRRFPFLFKVDSEFRIQIVETYRKLLVVGWSLSEIEILLLFYFINRNLNEVKNLFPYKTCDTYFSSILETLPSFESSINFSLHHAQPDRYDLVEETMKFNANGNSNFYKVNDYVLSIASIQRNERKKQSQLFESYLKDDKSQAVKFEDCLKYDLTSESLLECFPDFELHDILEYVESCPEFNPSTITSGEKRLMKILVAEKNSLDEVIPSFPLRDKQIIKSNYHAMVYASGKVPKFKNGIERLIYEQGMTMNTDSSGRRNSRRSLQSEFDLDMLQKYQKQARKIEYMKPVKPEGKEKSLLKSERTKRLHITKKEKIENRRAKTKELWIKRRLSGTSIGSQTGISKTPTLKTEIRDLNAGFQHFQTVAGDRQKIIEGSKRKRIQSIFFEPSTEPIIKRSQVRQNQKAQARLQLKKEALLKRKNEKLVKKRKYTRKVASDFESTPEPSDDDFLETQLDEVNRISKYDPPDLNADTLIPLYNRQLYIDSIYHDEPSLPTLNFRDLKENESIKDAMTSNDGTILFDDGLAAHVVGSHIKCYNELPISFPTYFNQVTIDVNYEHSVKIRFLLYPEHSESYVLAEPKDNELDPVLEIMKVIMIHYALYFSHSEKLKDIINEYCHQLEASITDSDFTEFLYIIDKWNLLMLYLSPNDSSASKILKEGKDLNAGVRVLLNQSEFKIPNVEELKLDIFYEEICFESLSPIYEPIIIKEEGIIEEDIIDDPNLDISIKNFEIPELTTTKRNYTKPSTYNSDFFKRLTTKDTISRYTMQQLLLRVYARVVSTDSRKLRSYKAFTAEVYGELLPSFTSEVLEKVELKPNQKFYDLGSGVGNTTLQAALEFGACVSGGCELMKHASYLTILQENLIQKHLSIWGLNKLNLKFSLNQSFVNNLQVQKDCLDSDILIINNYLFDGELNAEVGRLLKNLKTGTKIISLRNFISPRYKPTFDTVFDRLSVEKHEMTDLMSVSWTANKVPYFISTVEDEIRPEYYKKLDKHEIGLYNAFNSRSGTPSIMNDNMDIDVNRDEEMDIDEDDEEEELHNQFDEENNDGESTPPTDQHSDNDK